MDIGRHHISPNVYPNNVHRELFFDIGVYLLISAGALRIWAQVVEGAISNLVEWGPHTIVYIPVLAMVLVPIQRLFIYYLKIKKE
jgi:hypothetical protein